MKENPDLLKPALPAPGTKGYLVLQHLNSADLRERDEMLAAESVIRLSLCDSEKGENPVSVYELLLDDDETHNPVEAYTRIRTWAAGFMLGASYAGHDLGLAILPMQMI